jgi:Domain of unknown function (DUF4407)
MSSFFIALSGARPEILEKCPSERGKFLGTGGAVLTTGVIAMVSMGFALHSVLGLSLFLAVPASVVWGLAIMSLDRWLVTTMPTDGKRKWGLAVPRFLMALLLGAVVSTPMVLQIFKPEIDGQIVKIQQQRAIKFQATQKSGSIGQEADRLHQAIAANEKVVSSGGDVPIDPAQDPKIKSLQAEIVTKQQESGAAYTEWQCQLYGGPKCPKKGDGVLAQINKAAYEKTQSRIKELTRQIDGRKRELTANDEASKKIRFDTAGAELTKDRAQLADVVKRQGDLQRSFDAENKVTHGLLIRLRALDELSGTNVTLNGARLLLFLLFLVIECLPITVKLLQRPGNYERLAALQTKREYREGRAGLIDDPAGGIGDAMALRGIWAKQPSAAPSPNERTAVTSPPPDQPAGDVPEGVDSLGANDHHGSLEAEALRGMRDTRVTPPQDFFRPSPGLPESGGLFGDDDEF